jgi:hypothetical protein
MIASAAACNVVRAALLAGGGEQACMRRRTQSLDPEELWLALQGIFTL